MTIMESTGETYRCLNCGWIWGHEDDFCPNCGYDYYITVPHNSKDIQQLQDNVKKWSDSAFGLHRLGTPIIHHLKAETDELIDALNSLHQGVYTNDDKSGLNLLREKKDQVLMEFADCFMLLIDAAAHEQITIDMLSEATDRKLEINKQRKWGKPNDLGYFEHIKE